MIDQLALLQGRQKAVRRGGRKVGALGDIAEAHAVRLRQDPQQRDGAIQGLNFSTVRRGGGPPAPTRAMI